MKKTFLSGVLAVVMVCAGCGYTAQSALPPHLKTIYVKPFENSINYTTATGERSVYFPFLEVRAHEAVIDRFVFDGNLRVVPSAEEADLILKVELIDYRRNPLRYTDDDDVQEYLVQIVVRLELLEARSTEPMWKYKRFIGEATHFVTGDQATSEESAVYEATDDLARRIVERTIENW